MKTTLDINDELLVKAKALSGRERISLTRLIEEGLRLRLPMVVAGCLRLVTISKIFPRPTPTKDALVFLAAPLKVPGVVMPELAQLSPFAASKNASA